jgi:hypothetical protein
MGERWFSHFEYVFYSKIAKANTVAGSPGTPYPTPLRGAIEHVSRTQSHLAPAPKPRPW